MTERDGFAFADVISDVIHRRDASMDSHHFQLWFELMKCTHLSISVTIPPDEHSDQNRPNAFWTHFEHGIDGGTCYDNVNRCYRTFDDDAKREKSTSSTHVEVCKSGKNKTRQLRRRLDNGKNRKTDYLIESK